VHRPPKVCNLQLSLVHSRCDQILFWRYDLNLNPKLNRKFCMIGKCFSLPLIQWEGSQVWYPDGWHVSHDSTSKHVQGRQCTAQIHTQSVHISFHCPIYHHNMRQCLTREHNTPLLSIHFQWNLGQDKQIHNCPTRSEMLVFGLRN
jgi:hypothetical protein